MSPSAQGLICHESADGPIAEQKEYVKKYLSAKYWPPTLRLENTSFL